MGYKALMTLDLENASTDQRDRVYELLRERKWYKLDDLTTAWRCQFNDGISRSDAVADCKEDVRDAARHGNIRSYKAALQLGKGDVEEF